MATKAFRTPSGGVSASGRKKAKAAGDTMPGTRGKFPIRNLSDLSNAKHDIGRTNEPRAKVVAYIDRKARQLGGSPVGHSRGGSVLTERGKATMAMLHKRHGEGC